MRCYKTRSKSASTIADTWITILAALAFLSFSTSSLGLLPSSIPGIRDELIPSDRSQTIFSAVILTARRSFGRKCFETKDLDAGGGGSNSINNSNTRRRILGTVFAAAVNYAMIPVPSLAAQETATTTPITTTSNFNYELGNGDCQTSCVRSCETSFPTTLRRKNRFLTSQNKNYDDTNDRQRDCLGACVRTGERYCHQTSSTKTSPSYADAPTSRYAETTNEPELRSARPIPSLEYNSDRGGAWRAGETATSKYVDTTKEPELQPARPIPGLRYNGNRGGAWRD